MPDFVDFFKILLQSQENIPFVNTEPGIAASCFHLLHEKYGSLFRAKNVKYIGGLSSFIACIWKCRNVPGKHLQFLCFPGVKGIKEVKDMARKRTFRALGMEPQDDTAGEGNWWWLGGNWSGWGWDWPRRNNIPIGCGFPDTSGNAGGVERSPFPMHPSTGMWLLGQTA